MSDLIAIGSALVASFAALYARWAALAAQRANDISMHNERLLIYKALLNHRAILATHGPKYPEEALWKFHDAVELTEFYYGKSEYNELKKLLDNSFEIQTLAHLWEITKDQNPEQFEELYKKTTNLHRATRDRCGEVAELLKPKLRL